MQGTNAHVLLSTADNDCNNGHVAVVPSLPWQHYRFWTGPAPSLLLQQHIPQASGSTCTLQANLGTAAAARLVRGIYARGACVLPMTPLLEVAAAGFASLLSSKPDQSIKLATALEANAASRLSLAAYEHVLLNCTMDWQAAACFLHSECSPCQPQLQLLRCKFARLPRSQTDCRASMPMKPCGALMQLACTQVPNPLSAPTAALASAQLKFAVWYLAPSLSEAAEALHRANSCTVPLLAFACLAITLQPTWHHNERSSTTEQAQLAVQKLECTELHVFTRHGASTLPTQLHGLSMSPIRPSCPRQYALSRLRMPMDTVEVR